MVLEVYFDVLLLRLRVDSLLTFHLIQKHPENETSENTLLIQHVELQPIPQNADGPYKSISVELLMRAGKAAVRSC